MSISFHHNLTVPALIFCSFSPFWNNFHHFLPIFPFVFICFSAVFFCLYLFSLFATVSTYLHLFLSTLNNFQLFPPVFIPKVRTLSCQLSNEKPMDLVILFWLTFLKAASLAFSTGIFSLLRRCKFISNKHTLP